MILDNKWSGKNGLHDEWSVLIKKSSEDKTTTVSVTLKEEQQCSLSALIDDFQEQIANIKYKTPTQGTTHT